MADHKEGKRLTYEWYLDGVRVHGQNSDTYTGPGGGMLQVRVRNHKAGETGAPGRDLPIGDEAVMTPEELDRLERLCAVATDGPWQEVPQNRSGPIIAHRYDTGEQMNPTGLRLVCHVLQRGNSFKQDKANAAFIAAARTALPDLIAEVRRLTAEVDRLREALKQTARQHLSTEWAEEEEEDDLIGAYDTMVVGARAALAPIPPGQEGEGT